MEQRAIEKQGHVERTRCSRRSFLASGVVLLGYTFFPRFLEKSFANTLSNIRVEPSDLEFASALEAARAIRRRELSSMELTQHILKRIQKYNPSLNAIVTLLPDEALACARAADDALAKKEWWGPLHGVPITVKDTFEVAGMRTTAGAPPLANYVPERDAVAVSRLRTSGAVILGHTNVPWPAADWQTYNEIFGTTNNPWDLKRTPGGSTGGGAAALAAGLSYLSLGSDLGGSIRVPAHFCGIYGHKPTLNLIPTQGQIPPLSGPPHPPEDLAVAGPLARSAADLKVALEILGGPDSEESLAYHWTLPSTRGARLSDYRIGFVVDDPLCPVSSNVKEVIIKTIEAFRKAGARLEEGWPSGVDVADQYKTYRFLLSAIFASPLRNDTVEKQRERAKQEGTLDALEAWGWTEPQPYMHFKAANYARMAARAVWQEYFRTHDAFLMPTSFVTAFPHDHSPLKKRTLSTPEGPRRYEDLLFWISFATLTGLPATTAPVGLTRDGLPVGIQIMGPFLEDATPIDLAGKLADVVGGFRTPDGYHNDRHQ